MVLFCCSECLELTGIRSRIYYDLHGDVNLSSFSSVYCGRNNYISNIRVGYLLGFRLWSSWKRFYWNWSLWTSLNYFTFYVEHKAYILISKCTDCKQYTEKKITVRSSIMCMWYFQRNRLDICMLRLNNYYQK
jgi:hypothetical protein